MAVTELINDMIPEDIAILFGQFQVSAQLIVFGLIVAFNWCLMKVVVSFLVSSNSETNLRNICCKAQRQIYYFEAEKEKLQKDIDRERERAQLSEERLQSVEERVIPLEKELAKLKSDRNQLQQKVATLESELEIASEAGFEANRLLSDFLSSQKENIDLSSSVETLQQQISKQAEVVARYEANAKQKDSENQQLIEQFKKINTETERLKILLKESEHNLEIFQTNNEQLKQSKSELNSKLNELEEEYSDLKIKSEQQIESNEQLSSDVQQLAEEIKQLKEEKSVKETEVESMKRILAKMGKPIDNSCELRDDNEIDSEICDKTLSEVYDIVTMEVQLKSLANDKNQLIVKLDEVNDKCKELNQKLNALEENNKTLESERENAVHDRLKAQMELEVMSKYYKQKELEFGKEIGVQHIQRQQKEDDASTMSDRLVTFEEENTSLRNDLKALKKEIAEKERQYKSQINHLEKQVHENWILARNAERKLEEAVSEASVLRQTLTMSVKSPIDGFGADSFLDDSSSSISDHFSGILPPPPPPPMPPPPMFNGMMAPMPITFKDESNSAAYWNQNVQPMSMPSMYPQMTPTSVYSAIQSDITNQNISYPNVDYGQPTANHWDSSSNRDTFSPMSHQSSASLHSQHINSYSDPMATNQMNHYHSSMSSVVSPAVDTKPSVEPLYSSQSQPKIDNNFNTNYNNNNFNESKGSSRPKSTNQSNDISLQTSMVSQVVI